MNPPTSSTGSADPDVGSAADTAAAHTAAGYATALAKLPRIGSARLRRLLSDHGPIGAWELLAGGGPLPSWSDRRVPHAELETIRAATRAISPDDEAGRCAAAGVTVRWFGGPGYPAELCGDPEAPGVLFTRGDVDAVRARRVGIVGTRNATAAGLATARALGGALASEGVTVVSGLALGIDGAAHTGVRWSGGPGRAVAVVGSGPDVVYPRRHRALWEWVSSDGLVMSEWPPGTPPEPWRFPERNRIIAMLAEVLVVVESRERGGSLITAKMAIERGVEVMAVPGSPLVRASLGTNRLLCDGAAPATCVDDVLAMLALDTRRQPGIPFDPRPTPDGDQAVVLAACEAEPCTLDRMVAVTGLALVDAALAAARLERAGWLVETNGWFEPTRTHFDTGARGVAPDENER